MALLTGSVLVLTPLPAVQGAEVSKVQKELDATAAEYSRLETQLAETDARRRKLEADLKVADRVIAEKAAAMQLRAGAIYKKGGVSAYMTDLLMSADPNVFFRRLHFMEILGKGDTELVDGLRVTQSRADEMMAELAATRTPGKARRRSKGQEGRARGEAQGRTQCREGLEDRSFPPSRFPSGGFRHHQLLGGGTVGGAGTRAPTLWGPAALRWWR